jgi:hypothetical protein
MPEIIIPMPNREDFGAKHNDVVRRYADSMGEFAESVRFVRKSDPSYKEVFSVFYIYPRYMVVLCGRLNSVNTRFASRKALAEHIEGVILHMPSLFSDTFPRLAQMGLSIKEVSQNVAKFVEQTVNRVLKESENEKEQ